MFIQDKHFLRPFHYILEAKNSLTQKLDFKVLLKCYSIKDEEIYQIEIDRKSQKIIFYYKNLVHIQSQNYFNNDFFMSNH